MHDSYPKTVVVAVWFLAVAAVPIRADDDGDPFLARALTTVRQFQFVERGEVQLALRSEPILHWTNLTRGMQEGAVYVWTHDGRPRVIGTVFVSVRDGESVRQKFAFHSLSAGPIEGRFSDEEFWEPQAGPEFVHIAETSVSESAPGRLVQMRNIARRFSASITYPDSKAGKLRLAPQPLLRYESLRVAVADGAIFAYSTGGTDPEVLLVVEAEEDEAGRHWRYAFVRFHYWGLEARDAGGVVWSVEPVMAMEGNYFNKPRHRSDPYNSFRVDARFPGTPIMVGSDR